MSKSTVKCKYCNQDYSVDTNHHCKERQDAIFGKKTLSKGKSQKDKNKRPSTLLADQIINHIRSTGGAAESVDVKGTYIEGKRYKDVMGKWQQLPGKYIPSFSPRPGFEDISAIKPKQAIRIDKEAKNIDYGQYVAIEIKIGRDKQSEAQKRREKEVNGAGGIYIIVNNFKQFLYLWEAI